MKFKMKTTENEKVFYWVMIVWILFMFYGMIFLQV
jgi:cell division protein FtsL